MNDPEERAEAVVDTLVAIILLCLASWVIVRVLSAL